VGGAEHTSNTSVVPEGVGVILAHRKRATVNVRNSFFINFRSSMLPVRVTVNYFRLGGRAEHLGGSVGYGLDVKLDVVSVNLRGSSFLIDSDRVISRVLEGRDALRIIRDLATGSAMGDIIIHGSGTISFGIEFVTDSSLTELKLVSEVEDGSQDDEE